MKFLTREYIRENIAHTKIIYRRGENIFHLGNYSAKTLDFTGKRFSYKVDGSYGEYDVTVSFNGKLTTGCTCPYPFAGCKHTVAVCLDLAGRLKSPGKGTIAAGDGHYGESEILTFEEIRDEVLESRKLSARTESFTLDKGETRKGEHFIVNKKGMKYTVTVHDPKEGLGHCSCPDFRHNRLGTCKHLIHVIEKLSKDKNYDSGSTRERMPFVHFFYDSYHQKPRFYYDRKLPAAVRESVLEYFDGNGFYKLRDLADLYKLLCGIEDGRDVRIDDYLVQKVNDALFYKVIRTHRSRKPDLSFIKAALYPYQKEGIEFGLYRKRLIIADEMGLGKTLQAIALAVLKKNVFGFRRALIVCPASLKSQWKREIERFTDMEAMIVSGPAAQRQAQHEDTPDFFVITNYEAVLRDLPAIRRSDPDLVILDEAQRIKNFETKTHQAVLSIPRSHSIVLTGTPLENKLEDLYSIVQFSDAELLSPLWVFSANHMRILKGKKRRIVGYKNLDTVQARLKNLVIRRKKEDVLDSLPEQIENIYHIDLTPEQKRIHAGYVSSLLPLLNKKILTPMDIRHIQQLLLCMRMVCDSTYLIDKKTNYSPKLSELEKVVAEIVLENGRKAVIFSEWTTMTYLIGKMLSGLGIPFVEFTGKVASDKRQALIDEFDSNPECKVFLSTDAGGVGLNLQSADCVINFELPWNPAKLAQRIGRVNRIGQKSRCVNVVNFIAKESIEESVAAGIVRKTELFSAVFDGGADDVDFSEERKTEMINRVRMMLNEELKPVLSGQKEAEELPESTPYFLNPDILSREPDLDFTKEEALVCDSPSDGTAEPAQNTAGEKPDPERMEEILENGLKFLSGLTAMATGKPLETEPGTKMVNIDRQTGEVTVKFKLPGFAR
ncbi:MAG: DEAD/DEAH box helicase family protein [Spirochaetales bacterium]|nr:DEAD/DEAH box helicase family protein [Spirochaetales bacterium]